MTVASAMVAALRVGGLGVVAEPARVRGLLNDVLGTAGPIRRAEVDAVVVAAEEGLPQALLDGHDPQAVLARLYARGLDAAVVGYVVRVWHHALQQAGGHVGAYPPPTLDPPGHSSPPASPAPPAIPAGPSPPVIPRPPAPPGAAIPPVIPAAPLSPPLPGLPVGAQPAPGPPERSSGHRALLLVVLGGVAALLLGVGGLFALRSGNDDDAADATTTSGVTTTTTASSTTTVPSTTTSTSTSTTTTTQPADVANVGFYDLRITSDIENNLPVDNLYLLAADTTRVCAWAAYTGMDSAMVWDARWYLDGQLLVNDSFVDQPWELAINGNDFWVCTADLASPRPAGFYEVVLYLDGQYATSESVHLGDFASADVTLINDLAYPVCGLYLNPLKTANLGPNDLGTNRQLAPGEEVSFSVVAEDHHVIIMDCAGLQPPLTLSFGLPTTGPVYLTWGVPFGG